MKLENDTNISHYKIISPIGAGGMGEVFLAEDTRLERKIAIKFLAREFSQNADRLRRFVQEAKAASALNHPNIITIHEIGEEQETHFIATEYIKGETLRARMQRAPHSLGEILEIAVQTASALAAAHAGGIVHRDIKPENVMLREDNLVKVLDFGLAKLTESENRALDAEAQTRVLNKTAEGVVVGTVAYMSPEQARGKETDARTDVWSLGVVLYEMLARRLPFEGETMNDHIASILKSEPLPLDDARIPDELKRIVRKALKKDKDARYQTMKGLLADLKDLREETSFSEKLERTASPERVRPTENQKTLIADARTTDRAGRAQTASGAKRFGSEIKKRKTGLVISSVLLLAVIGLGGWFFLSRVANTKQIESIAVLPFVNQNGDADTEYLSDGMTEMLINSLSQLPKLSVKARSSVFRYKGKETALPEIGQELNVQAILTGRIVQRGDALTLSWELVDAQTETHLAGGQYNRKASELVSLQTEIARDVSQKLKTKLSGTDEQRLAKSYTDNPEAYRLYLQGRFFWNKRGIQNLQKAIEYFEQAITIDPGYALAYTGLADAHASADYPLDVPKAREYTLKAREYALKALSLDDGSAEAHASLGTALLKYNYDFSAAERAYRRAIELNPNYATAHQFYSRLLDALGRHDKADAEIRRALELEPLSLPINWFYGIHLFVVRDYDASIRQLRKTVELDPSFTAGHTTLADALILNGMYSEAIEQMAKVQELRGKPENAALMRKSCARVGWRECWRTMTTDGSPFDPFDLSPFSLARMFAELGERDKAFVELEKAFQIRQSPLIRLKVDPRLDPLRDDPRFQELLRRVGLPQ